MYGFLAPMILMFILYLIKRRQTSRITLTICASGLTAFTLMIVVRLWDVATLVEVFLDRTTSLAERHATYLSKEIIPARAINWLQFIPPVLNDAFIIWRAWVIFQRRKWALYLSVILCLSTFALTLVFLILYASAAGNVEDWNGRSKRIHALSATFSGLSISTNLVATSFIGWTLWSHLKFIKNASGSRHPQMFKVPRVLMLLVDSGALYMTLQITRFVLQFALDSTNVTYYILCCIQLVYPSITMVLIHGPFSIAGAHDTVMSVYDSRDSTWA
ncbi:hypothetical protein DXG01_008174 [Tephrocybe rancida]|nr:hypothetical protein DXG01_008174 [Tephrocybe rancida]